MIIEKIDEVVKEEQIKLDDVRFKSLHVSEMAICGYKYRFSRDNNLKIPHKWLFEIGNAFEYIMVKKLKKIYPNGQTQYVIDGTNDKGEPVEKKPIVAYTEVENYIDDNALELPASVDLTLTVIEDGKGDNTYKHFEELSSHIDVKEAFGE